jgi:eukaryotic-like serine/threonine-protein kinase
MSTPPPPPNWPTNDTLVAPPPPAGPPPVVPDPEPGNRIGLGMLLAIVFLAIVAAVLAVVFVTRNHHSKPTAARTVFVTTNAKTTHSAPVSVPVPSLVGLSKADAVTQLRRAGFSVTLATVPGSAPAGTVSAQSPAGGTSKPSGSTVRLNLSSGQGGAAPKTTPVAAKTPPPAATTTAPATTTTAAAPAPQQPTTASVPALSGDGRSAIEQLSSAGFRITIAYVPATSTLGTVVSQSPSSGASAPTGSHVTVNLSAGRSTAPQKSIPDLTGKTVNEALAALNAAGLRLVELKAPVTDRTQVGKIVEQSPAAGKTAPQNASVLVYWGAFEK